MRLVRVARTLDQYIEYGAAVLILLIFMFVLIAHWLACTWFTIGDYETHRGVSDSWLYKLAHDIGEDFVAVNSSTTGEVVWTGGPSMAMSYTTALYFTLTCITSVGFGNICAVTEYEKIFAIGTMIFGC